MIKKIIPLLLILILGCENKLQVVDDLSNDNYFFLNQDSVQVSFPKLFKDKIGVVAYIFTNCPDICPLTTNNMRRIRDELIKQKISDVEFVSISFDPAVDSPSVLKNFSKLHGVQFPDWSFLTGTQKTIDELLDKITFTKFVGDSSKISDSTWTYFYTHTDRIQLFDQEGKVRRNYLGSKIEIQQIINDIKNLK